MARMAPWAEVVVFGGGGGFGDGVRRVRGHRVDRRAQIWGLATSF
jgi:hypothetical protein